MDWELNNRSELNLKISQKLLDIRKLDNKMKEIIRSMDIDKIRLSSEMTALQKTNKKLEKENIDLRNRVERTSILVEKLVESNDDKDIRLVAQKDALGIHKTQIAFLQRGKLHLQKQLKDLSNELEAQKEESVTFRTQISDYRNTISDLHCRLRQKTESSTSSSSANWINLNLTEDMYKTKLKKNEQIIENLTEKVKNLKKENKRMSAKSSNESLFKKYCDNEDNKILFKIMKEGVCSCNMNELNQIFNLISYAKRRLELGEDTTVSNLPSNVHIPVRYLNNEVPYDLLKMSSTKFDSRKRPAPKLEQSQQSELTFRGNHTNIHQHFPAKCHSKLTHSQPANDHLKPKKRNIMKKSAGTDIEGLQQPKMYRYIEPLKQNSEQSNERTYELVCSNVTVVKSEPLTEKNKKTLRVTKKGSKNLLRHCSVIKNPNLRRSVNSPVQAIVKKHGSRRKKTSKYKCEQNSFLTCAGRRSTPLKKYKWKRKLS